MDQNNSEGQVIDTGEAQVNDSPPSTADRIAADNAVKREAIVRSVEPQEEQVKGEKPAGYLPIDFKTATPEQIEDRMDYVYKQMKSNEKTAKTTEKTLSEYRAIAQAQAAQIEELMSATTAVVDHLHTQSTEENESTVRAQMQTAFETGDTTAYLAAQERLMEIKLLKATKPKQQQKPQNQQPQTTMQRLNSASEMAQDSVTDGELTQQDADHVSAWQSETDTSGQLLRPWAHTSDPSDPDPDYLKALATAKRVWVEHPNMTAEQKLAEVDRRMGVQTRSGGQTVMGGNLTSRPAKQKISLSPELQKLAVRTKFGGPKAKSDADHIEAYRKQIEKVQSSRRSR